MLTDQAFNNLNYRDKISEVCTGLKKPIQSNAAETCCDDRLYFN